MDSLDKIYYDLTWPEINEAVLAGKVVLLPLAAPSSTVTICPLDTDNFLARRLY
ncbi:MAG: hypothetical protein R2911_29455 [Caldilineaceae bacterium]